MGGVLTVGRIHEISCYSLGRQRPLGELFHATNPTTVVDALRMAALVRLSDGMRGPVFKRE
jgi:hypothetical protein